ncbi:hypothetical protein ACJJTC_013799 [Scirpophaga incertulas]
MHLVQLIAANTVVNNKATNATNNKMKDQAWKNITDEFNSSISSFPRTPAQLRLKWENLKKTARKRYANIRSSHNKTGGGKDYFPPEVLDKVSSLLGSTCQGFTVEFGGDATVPKNAELGIVLDKEPTCDEQIVGEEGVSKVCASEVGIMFPLWIIQRIFALVDYLQLKSFIMFSGGEDHPGYLRKFSCGFHLLILYQTIKASLSVNIEEVVTMDKDANGESDGVCGGDVVQVLKEIQIIETPSPKH